MFNYFTTPDKVQLMIMRKISISDNSNTDNKRKNLIKFRSKQFKKTSKPTQSRLNNNIVIMNMPPSKVDFLQNQQIKEFRSLTQRNKLTQSHFINPYFQNPHIKEILTNYQSIMIPDKNTNKQNFKDQDNYLLKRYNSLDIRLSSSNGNRKNTFQQRVLKGNLVKIQDQSQNLFSKKISVPVSEFRPCFKQLLKRNSKIHAEMSIKMKKSDFNYQRAISTSCLSRKKTFNKILLAFQIANNMKQWQNPQQKNIKIPLSRQNSTSQKSRLTKQTFTGHKTSRKFVQPKQLVQKVNTKDQQACRPWSAGKKALIVQKNTQQQNPLQFYSINQKHEH